MEAKRVDTSAPLDAHRLSDGRTLAELCQDVFGGSPQEIQSLGEGSNDCRAFKLRVKDQKIKCYECQSAERASLAERATQILLAERVSVPHILAVVDHVVFAQWVSGKPLTEGQQRSWWQRMAAYQAQIHQANLSTSDTSDFRFIHLDWLLQRLASASRNYACPDHIDFLSESLRQLTPPELKAGIVQPDFIKSNLIVTETGELVMVDNELLGIGLGFEFDILNTSHVISAGDQKMQRRYLDAYAEVGDLGTLDEHEAYWDLCYLTKLAGKRFLIEDAGIGNVCLELLEMKLQAYSRGER